MAEGYPTPPWPGVEQVRQLFLADQLTIPESWEDQNGHVNIRYYMQMHSDAGWNMMGALGYQPDFVRTRRRGVFDLTQHLEYRSEILVGDDVAIYATVIARNEKRFHGISFIVNETRNEVANSFEYVTAYVDLEARRSTRIDDDIVVGLDRMIDAHAALSWDVPVCGALALARD